MIDWSQVSRLADFLYEPSENITEACNIALFCVKYVNNKLMRDRPYAKFASIDDVLNVAEYYGLWGHSNKRETLQRAVRELYQLGILYRCGHGQYYHPDTQFGRWKNPQKQFVENKRSWGWRNQVPTTGGY